MVTEGSTERSTLLRSGFPSVGRLHLAANLPTREVARSRVRWRDTIVGVDIHIRGSRGQVLQQSAHRFAHKGADELRRVEGSFGQDAAEVTATGRRRRWTADWITPNHDHAP